MRWLVALALVAHAADARDMEMPRPAPVRACRRAASVDKVEACLKKLGKTELVGKLANARLYRVTTANPDEGGDLGLSLYVERDGGWQLGGAFDARGLTYEVLSAAPLVVGKHSGFRIDLGQVMRTWAPIDGGQTVVPVLVTSHRVLLCGGDSWSCSETMLGCDVIVRGAAVWTFHGTLTIADNQIEVAGDRSHTGAFCSVPETQFLGWTQPQ